jgi:flagellar biosynthesis protein FlhG
LAGPSRTPRAETEGGRHRRAPSGSVRTIAVTSGKGGVGKTSVVINLAVALAEKGVRVAILDADYGLGNIDILLGLEAERTLEDVLRGHLSLDRVLLEGPAGVRILPAANGVQDLTSLTNEQQLRLRAALSGLAGSTDVLLVDTATGISDNVVTWLRAADEVLVVTSPDPAAIVDAYAVFKLLVRIDADKPLALLVNLSRDEEEAAAVHEGIAAAVREFLHGELPLFGHVVRDPALEEAARRRHPIVTLRPSSPASRCFRRLARALLAGPPSPARAEEQASLLAPAGK